MIKVLLGVLIFFAGVGLSASLILVFVTNMTEALSKSLNMVIDKEKSLKYDLFLLSNYLNDDTVSSDKKLYKAKQSMEDILHVYFEKKNNNILS